MKHINYKIAVSCLSLVGILSFLTACEQTKVTDPAKPAPSSSSKENVTIKDGNTKNTLNDRHLRSPLDEFER